MSLWLSSLASHSQERSATPSAICANVSGVVVVTDTPFPKRGAAYKPMSGPRPVSRSANIRALSRRLFRKGDHLPTPFSQTTSLPRFSNERPTIHELNSLQRGRSHPKTTTTTTTTRQVRLYIFCCETCRRKLPKLPPIHGPSPHGKRHRLPFSADWLRKSTKFSGLTHVSVA
jgi:hypothetical protein